MIVAAVFVLATAVHSTRVTAFDVDEAVCCNNGGEAQQYYNAPQGPECEMWCFVPKNECQNYLDCIYFEASPGQPFPEVYNGACCLAGEPEPEPI
jgi:hypothetical protein